jgi:biotin operon repressor
MTEFNEKLHAFLKTRKNTLSLEQLSDHFNCGISKVKKAMEELAASGHNIRIVSNAIELSRDIPKSEPTTIDVSKLNGKTIRFGLTADNHLGSKYCRLDVLNALFDIWAKEGIKDVYQLGNMIDGEARFNKFDIIAHGINGQTEYFVKHWPKRRGITTHFITGDDHEGWYVQREGINIGQFIEDAAKHERRNDLKYLGHMEHDIIFAGGKNKAIMRLIHAGGGSAYATSYSVQKIVESYQGGEKPNILLVGHYHKAEYGYPREVHVVQAGCTEDQTPFMRKLKIQAHVGGWIIEFGLNSDGFITRFKTEWIPFYDLGFYRNWKYNH